MKMTRDNFVRSIVTVITLGAAVITGIELHHHSPNASLPAHIFISVGGLALLVRTIYAYVKGE